MKYVLIALVAVCGLANYAEARVKTQSIEYDHNGVTLEGFAAFPPGNGPFPGVLIVHQWKGLSDFEMGIAQRLAEQGFVAFAADVYGKGIRPSTMQQAGEQAGMYRADRQLMRGRVQAGLDLLKGLPDVDSSMTAAIGYCFGGGCVLELARGGAVLKGVVSFHGNLDTPDPADANKINCSVLVLHGADDPHVPPEQVTAFADEMRSAGVDWQFTEYGGAVHAFTDHRLPSDPSTGAAYHEQAAKRAWQAMLSFFDELF